jgi:Putative bacterial sensory transduction regulator
MRSILLRSSMFAAAAVAVSAPAHAELVTPKSPEVIAGLIRSMGMPAKVVSKPGENPYIESKYSGLVYLVFFMTCDDSNKNCKTIQYYMGYSDAKETSLEKINDWNRDHRFARAYRDNEGDPVLEMDIDLDFAGLPRENVIESLRTWQSLMDQYQKHLFGAADSSAAPLATLLRTRPLAVTELGYRTN